MEEKKCSSPEEFNWLGTPVLVSTSTATTATNLDYGFGNIVL